MSIRYTTDPHPRAHCGRASSTCSRANVTLRERDVETGVMRDTVVTRVPLKLGLDLQGGMHLALELDQSKQVSADPARDLDLALTVLRKRIDEFGVAEPVIQKVGERADRGRARRHRRSGAGQGHRAAQRLPRVPDHRQDRALWRRRFPRWTACSGSLGVARRRSRRRKPSAVEQLLGGDSASKPVKGDSAKRDTSAAADTAAVTGGFWPR